jgi:hypothetical protein
MCKPSLELNLEVLKFENLCQNQNYMVINWEKIGLKPTPKKPPISFKESKSKLKV